jgi:hypothetical protein
MVDPDPVDFFTDLTGIEWIAPGSTSDTSEIFISKNESLFMIFPRVYEPQILPPRILPRVYEPTNPTHSKA